MYKPTKLEALILEVFLMLNTSPGKYWDYYETDRDWWTLRLWISRN